MPAELHRLRSLLGRLHTQHQRRVDYGCYAADPVGYCRQVLQVQLTPTQERIARLLVTPPYKVLVRAGHNVGKSFLAACLVNWWYDCFRPGVCLTTAPTDRQVKDILWKEVRTLRGGRGGFTGPKEPRLQDNPAHFAHGFTARDGDRFQGQHSPHVFIIFDEAVGVEEVFWEAARTMLGGERFAFLAIYNPTDQSSRVFQEEREQGYHPVVTMSALDHPNIEAELAGREPPYPSAIRLERLWEMLTDWATPISDPQPGDVVLGKQAWSLGPVAEARLAGRWPTRAVNSVWSEALFLYCVERLLPEGGPLQLGCDVARFGDDSTTIHLRRGGNSLHHESHNGWSTTQTVVRLRELVVEWAAKLRLDPKQVPIAVDDSGVGGGVTDGLRAIGLRVLAVNAACEAPDPNEFPNLRSALWFGLADEAAAGNVSFARLSPAAREALRVELIAPRYVLDARGRRVVERKEITKERLGRSPDNADGLNLAYLSLPPSFERVTGRVKVPA